MPPTPRRDLPEPPWVPMRAPRQARGRLGKVLRRRRWLLSRRLVQAGVMALFLLGPWAGLWLARGTLAASQWFGTVQLTDPFVALQSLAAGASPAAALTGAALVALAYLLLGGRTYCAWVCPINPLTDLAAWLRRRLGLPALLAPLQPDRRLRLAVLAAALALSAVLGSVAWEVVNPITLLQRALVFGLTTGYGVALAIFLFDLLLLPRGWCGHLCPVGAFYGVLGRVSPLRVAALRRSDCSQCGECFRVCPEPHVIAPALHGRSAGRPPAIDSGDCLRCGRCIEVCDDDVFGFVLGNGRNAEAPAATSIK